MAKRLIYVGQDDDVSDLAGKVQGGDTGDDVALVVPPGAQAFQTPLNLRLLRSVGAKRGMTASVVSPDPRIQDLARTVGLPAYSSVAAYEEGVAIEAPRPGQPPFRGALPPQRPQAPFLARPPAPAVPAAAGVTVTPDPAIAATPAVAPASRPSPWEISEQPVRSPFATPVPAPAPAVPAGPWTPATGAPGPEGVPPWAAAGSAGGGEGAPPWAGAGTAVAARSAATVLGAPPAPASSPPAPPGTGASPRRPAAPPPHRSPLRSRGLYFVLVALGVVGIVAFLLLSPSATVTVTVAEQPLTVNPTIQGTTVAAQASQPNYVLSKQITDSGSSQFPATPTGSQAVPAVAATGNVVLSAISGGLCSSSPGGCSLTLRQGDEFETSGGTPTLFQVTQTTDVVVPAGGGASNSIPVSAVTPGTGGNVPAGAIDQWVCAQTDPNCQPDETALQVSNPGQLSGGVDATTQVVASASDVQSWQAQLQQAETQLSSKATTDLATKAGGDKVAVDPGGGGRSVTFTVTPSSFPSVAAGTVMSAETVTVAMSAQETVYDPSQVQAVVLNDLKASGNLPSGDTLVPSQLTLSNLSVITAGSDGSFALSVTGTDYYRPAVDFNQLRDRLTGASPGSVPGIIESQLSNVNGVTVHETPLQLFFMPFFSNKIQIVETFVTAPSGNG